MIKEVRANVYLITKSGEIVAAADLLKNEKDVLKIAKKRWCLSLPHVHDYFEEEKHFYLVMSSPAEHDRLMNLEAYLTTTGGLRPEDAMHTALQMLNSLASLHSAQIVWNDAAARNCLLNPADGIKIHFIDFEKACAAPSQNDLMNEIRQIGIVLLSLLVPLPAFFANDVDVSVKLAQKWLGVLSFHPSQYSPALLDCILACLLDPPDIATLYATLVKNQNQQKTETEQVSHHIHKAEEQPVSRLETIHALLRFRKEMRFDTNRLIATSPDHTEPQSAVNILYGASGYALTQLYLEQLDSAFSLDSTEKERLGQWILDRRGNSYESGLNGDAGIALALLSLGEEAAASRLRRTLQAKREQPQSPYLFGGISGDALACLRFYDETGDERFLDQAEALRNDLCRRVLKQGEFHWEGWKDQSDEVWLGMSGVCGILIFLFEFSKRTNASTGSEALYTAHRGLDYVRSKCYRQWDGRFSLPQYVGSKEISRNLAFGSTALAVAVCADPNADKNDRHHDLENILLPSQPSLSATFNPTPGLLFGLSGEILANVAAYQKTQDPRFLKQADAIFFREITLFLDSEKGCEIDDLANGNIGMIYALATLLAAHQSMPSTPAFIAF